MDAAKIGFRQAVRLGAQSPAGHARGRILVGIATAIWLLSYIIKSLNQASNWPRPWPKAI